MVTWFNLARMPKLTFTKKKNGRPQFPGNRSNYTNNIKFMSDHCLRLYSVFFGCILISLIDNWSGLCLAALPINVFRCAQCRRDDRVSIERFSVSCADQTNYINEIECL
ncbi:hypothetical protein BLOT_016316, partial [Blomia tropicalis]